MRIFLGAVALALALSGCGGDDERTPAEQAGCKDPAPAETEELYVQEAYDCADGGRLLTFADNEARDAFVDIAEHFGGQYETGDAWAYEKP